ncbi:hypothetical protein Gain_0027_034 [Komagataeibacter intermedius TF2]|uniref:HicA-like toxin n=1 Tax=Komagataeibacter intermedius NRIC 0521 TaxID=1307934 RepID=A0ABQ0PH62_9PROT|nr:hypothetical protein Gain_0027_034 [Komagataeibacter intermedius TF2]GBQ67964.1 hypothetical protein AA0521_1117 [Komagataeibacter intermedius NRIC 0521]
MIPRAQRRFQQEMQARGWSVSVTRGGHLKWTHSNGAIYFSAGTPGDRRAVKNARAAMRRLEK